MMKPALTIGGIPFYDAPSEVEGSLSFLLCLFLVFLDDVGVDRAGLQEDPSGEGGLSVVDVADDDQIHVLFLCHCLFLRCGTLF